MKNASDQPNFIIVMDLKLKENGSYFYYYAYIVIKDGEEQKTGYHVHLDNKPEKFDIDTFVAKVAKNGLDKLSGKPCNSGLYPAILNQELLLHSCNSILNMSTLKTYKKDHLFCWQT